MTNTHKKKILLIVVVVGFAVALALVYRFRGAPVSASTPTGEGDVAATEPFELEAYLARVRARDPGDGFDQAAHEAALHQVGPAHQEAQVAMAQAHAAMRTRERALLEEGTAGAALAKTIRELREQLLATRVGAAATAQGETVAPEKTAAAEALRAQLAVKQDELQQLYNADAEWCDLHAAYEVEDAKRKKSAARLQAVIRARMQAEHAIAQTKKVIAETSQRPLPEAQLEAPQKHLLEAPQKAQQEESPQETLPEEAQP